MQHRLHSIFQSSSLSLVGWLGFGRFWLLPCWLFSFSSHPVLVYANNECKMLFCSSVEKSAELLAEPSNPIQFVRSFRCSEIPQFIFPILSLDSCRVHLNGVDNEKSEGRRTIGKNILTKMDNFDKIFNSESENGWSFKIKRNNSYAKECNIKCSLGLMPIRHFTLTAIRAY